MALMREVFPIPESPAINTFKRPMALPVSVKGLRLGILMLGIISCGEVPLAIMVSPSLLLSLSLSTLKT
jgi:hypothetical protein